MTDYREAQRVRSDIDALKLKAGSTVWLMQRGLSLANDAAETTVFSKTLWGGILNTDNGLLIEHIVRHLNNSGANQNFSLRFKWGGSTVFTRSYTFTTSATERLIWAKIKLVGAGATNAQTITVRLEVTFADMATDSSVNFDDFTAAIDSTADQTVSITWQHSAAAATITADERLTVAHFIGAVS